MKRPRQRFKWRELQWSRVSMVHNLFRLFEFVFGRKRGIRIENRTLFWREANGKEHIRREFYTAESLLVFFEQLPRIAWLNLKSRWQWENLLQPQVLYAGLILLLQGFKVEWMSGTGMMLPLFGGAVAFDTVNSPTINTGTGQNISYSHTTSGSDRGLFTANHARPTTITQTTHTYAGAAFTNIDNQSVEVWQQFFNERAAPATGANTVALDWSAAPTGGAQSSVATSFTGTHQTDLVGASAKGTAIATGISTNITTTVDNSMVFDTWMNNSGANAPTVGALQTQRWNQQANGNQIAGSTEPTTTAGVYTMSWTDMAESRENGNILAEIKEAVASVAVTSIPTLLTLGIG